MGKLDRSAAATGAVGGEDRADTAVVGAPVLALPCGPAELGLPASLQLVGRPGDDALVLAAGALLERAIAGRGGASGTL